MLRRLPLAIVATLLTLTTSLYGQVEGVEELSDIVTQSYDSAKAEINNHRYTRGLVRLDNPIVPKGLWITGASASYSTHENSNYTLAIVEGINSSGYTVTTSPLVAYTFADNMAAGVRFEYSRSRLIIDSAELSFGEEGSSVDLSVVDYYTLQHDYTAMALFRQYIPLGYAKRFGFFVETRLEYGGSVSKFAFDQPVTGTFSKGYNLGVGIVPGVVAFATDFIAIEVTVGMMGLQYSHTEQVHNQVYVGSINSSMMNFKLNLFSIGLGVAFYL